MKFAKYRPDQAETDTTLQQAYDLVNTTKLLPRFETDKADNGAETTEAKNEQSQSDEIAEATPATETSDELAETNKEEDAS